MSVPAVTASPTARERGSLRQILRFTVVVAGLLVVVPWVVPPYTAILLAYGLIMAIGALIVGVVREAGIAWFPEIELAVLYLAAAIVLLVRPAGLFGRP